MLSVEEKISDIKAKMTADLESVSTSEGLTRLFGEYLGKSGAVTMLSRELGKAAPADRPVLGKAINALRGWAEEQFKAAETIVKQREMEERYLREAVDVTLPGEELPVGGLNPVCRRADRRD